MKFNKLARTLIASSIVALVGAANASTMTIEDAELKRKAIMASDANYQKKIDDLMKLEELLKINARIKSMTNPPPPPVDKVVVEKQEQEEEAYRHSVLQQQQGQRIAKMRELMATTDSGIYLASFFKIGNDITVDLIVNGQERPEVDVHAAIANKTRFGNYKIIGTQGRTITVRDTRSGNKNTLSVQRATEIMNRIAYENKVTREYAKSIVMGELDADLKAAGEPPKNDVPLKVNYKTAVKPASYDSIK